MSGFSRVNLWDSECIVSGTNGVRLWDSECIVSVISRVIIVGQ